MSSMVMDGASPRSRATDPTTSVDAGRSVDLTGSQAHVLAILEERGPSADFEIENAADWAALRDPDAPRFSPQRLRSARAELVEAGLVLATAAFRTTSSGRRTQIWAVASG